LSGKSADDDTNGWNGTMGMNGLLRFTLAIGFILLTCGSADADPRVVFLGDSVTRAVRPGVTSDQTFCTLFEKGFRASGVPIEAINAGVGGNTTADALARFERDVLARKPGFVVIMFGLNDSWIDEGKTASRLTVTQYRDNLRSMIATLKARGTRVVLMTPNPAIAPKYGPERNVTLRPYVEAVREIAQVEGLPLIDVYGRFAELALEGVELNTLFTDAMHPNPAGQRVIAEMLITRFRPLLADRH
jgi:acyl-CoA thioesterase-1